MSNLPASNANGDAHGATEEIAQVATADGAILFDRSHIAQADAALFDPQSYPQRRSDDSRGGRGAVWFLSGEFGGAVLRHYRRGGLLGRINRDLYLWTGAASTRAFREFHLLAELRRRGLPVPAPLAARYTRGAFWYRADILIALVPGARTLAQHLDARIAQPSTWIRLGELLARFHREGVFHADLNAHNVLFDANDEIWLIDFDRGALRPPETGWQAANLQRLQRSLRKLGAASVPGWDVAWDSLLAAYRSARASVPGVTG